MGTIDAEAIGAFKGKITDRIIKEYSPSVASEFLDRMTRLALRGHHVCRIQLRNR